MSYGGNHPQRPDQLLQPISRAGVGPAPQSTAFIGRLIVVFGTGPATGIFFYNGSPSHGNPPILAITTASADPYGNTVTASAITDSGMPFLVYSGTPALGNLIVAAAPAAGTDAFGNSYPEGLSASAGTLSGPSILGAVIQGGLFQGSVIDIAGNPSGIFVYSGGSPGPVNPNFNFAAGITGYAGFAVTLAPSTLHTFNNSPGSMQVTPDGIHAGPEVNTNFFAIQPSTSYGVTAQVNIPVGYATGVRLVVFYYDATHTLLSTNTGPTVAISAATETQLVYIPPASGATAAFCKVEIQYLGTPASSVVMYVGLLVLGLVGTLSAAIVSAAGTDQFANPYPAGFTIFNTTFQTAAAAPFVQIDGPNNRINFKAAAGGTNPGVLETAASNGSITEFADVHWLFPANSPPPATLRVTGFVQLDNETAPASSANGAVSYSSSAGALAFVDQNDALTYDTARKTLAGPSTTQTISSTSFTTITGLSAAVAIGTYRVRVTLICTQGGAAFAVATQVSGPAASIVNGYTEMVVEGAGVTTNVKVHTTLPTSFTGPAFGAGANFVVRMDLYLTFTAAGTLAVQAAQGVAGHNWQVDADSFMELMPVTA